MSNITLEEYELLGESKYRSYVQIVEKALKNFEYTSEWADLISALGKLNKILLAHVKYPIIPKRITISKRLSQCMHPALPSGVHLKALETYDIIFKCMGTKRLIQDLFIYSAGLFPLFANAAMNVKPVLLSIYENHFTPLGPSLKPGLSGFLLGLLPGLEESSEYYDRTNSLLEKTCEATDPTFFYGSLWEIILANSSIRLPALTFILAHFNKKQSMEDQLYMIGTSIDTMVEALCYTVEDSSVLVQRSALDFLLLGFPLHNSQLLKDDMIKIIKAALNALLRRDMSLNRRLYSWLLGSETSSENIHSSITHSTLSRSDSVTSSESVAVCPYFETFSKDALIVAVKQNLQGNVGNPQLTDSGKPANLKPFRILISLLDKPEIGPVIVEDVLLEVFQWLHSEYKRVTPCESTDHFFKGVRKSKNQNKTNDVLNSADLIKNANLLFSTFEPYFIWDYIARLFEDMCQQKFNETAQSRHQSNRTSTRPLQISELCTLTEFLLEIISVETYIEIQTDHLPQLLNQICSSLSEYCLYLIPDELTCSLQLCSKILAKVLPSMNIEDKMNLNNVKSQANSNLVSELIFKDIEQKTEIGPSSPDIQKLVFTAENSPVSSVTEANHYNEGTAFSDFQQHDHFFPEEEKLFTNVLPDHLKTFSLKLSPRQGHVFEDVPHTLMEMCVNSFQNFFAIFVCNKILPNKSTLLDSMNFLIVLHDRTLEERTEQLETLLKCCQFDRNNEFLDKNTFVTEPYQSKQFIITISDVEKEFTKAFSCACRLLVEFYSFPIYCTDQKKLLTSSWKLDLDAVVLPEWLQVLLTCSCFLDQFELQAAAIATMLDLISLTKSVMTETTPLSAPDLKIPSQGTVAVVIVPALSTKHLHYITERTQFYKVIGKTLWDKLGPDSPIYHQISVDLFYQLLHLSVEGVCENIMGSAMTHPDQLQRLEAFHKFSVLWHLSRDVLIKISPSVLFRALDRSMFLMLDNLMHPTGPQRTLTQTWLIHAIQQGDLARILEPLALILLQANTARVSVQHITLHKPLKIKLVDSKRNSVIDLTVYTVNTEDGSIIYHFHEDTHHGFSLSPEAKIFAVTTILENKNLSESKGILTSSDSLTYFPHSTNFGSQGSLSSSQSSDISSSNVDIALKLDNLWEVDSSFDTSLTKLSDDNNEPSSYWLAFSILEELINNVLKIDIVTNEIEESKNNHNLSNSRLELDDFEFDEMEPSNPQSLSVDLGSESKYISHKYQNNISQTKNMYNPPRYHMLHTHMLIYSQVYDSQRTLYALSSLKSILNATGRLAVISMASTSISGSQIHHYPELLNLLAKHRRSVFGKNFFSEVTNESLSNYRSCMFLEMIISVCLYYIRSYYPNLMLSQLTPMELQGNKEAQVISAEVLILLFSELIHVVKSSGKGFTSYIRDLLSKCKVQKTVLHCTLASVYNSRKKEHNSSDNFTEAIIQFNEEGAGGTAELTDSLQEHLLKLVLVLIILEEELSHILPDKDPLAMQNNHFVKPKIVFVPHVASVRYYHSESVASQSMFLSAILSALKQQHRCRMHRHWISMIISAFPYMGKALPHIVIATANQICQNLELLAIFYEEQSGNFQKSSTANQPEFIPPDHVITVLEGLTTMCHYCLLDNSGHVTVMTPPPMNSLIQMYDRANASQILTNLINVFTAVDLPKDSSSRESSPSLEPLLQARRSLLSNLPRLISAMTILWHAIHVSEKMEASTHKQPSCYTLGKPKAVRQRILEFLSPISRHHGNNFLAAIAVAWNERRKKNSGFKKVLPLACEDQLLLVELVSAIKVMPTDTLFQTVKQVLKQPPTTNTDNIKNTYPLEVSLLQFFYAYVQHIPGSQLLDSWSSLLSLLKESLQINLLPPGQFLLLGILNEFVQKAPFLEVKKDQKDLQDISQKLVEACSNIAGSSLEQTTWLRRNLAVKLGPQSELAKQDELIDNSIPSVPEEQQEVTKSYHNVSQYSVQALGILAEFLAPLLDVVYVSDEKEKVVPLLTTVMYNVMPYLRNHSAHNVPSFRTCSQLLASLSGYQYTRKAWKKDAFELLLDPLFFQMNPGCISYWRTVIDNLTMHDKATFRDLMARVAISQNSSLNLFSNREQEFEQRAQLLKRLAFVIFCSDIDQYQKFMPEIQERLSESLRLPHIPSVHAQVFFCFRVMLLRISSQHLTSLWPTIITEMVQVFLQIEQELSTDTEEFRTHLQRLSTMDSTWVLGGNGLNAHNNPGWLHLYLAVCRLLDLALALPTNTLPQFQLYAWAFVGDCGKDATEVKNRQIMSDFVPYVIRIANLLNKQLESRELLPYFPGCPLLKLSSIKSLQQLHPFFSTLVQLGHLSCKIELPHKITQPLSIHKSQSFPSIGNFVDYSSSLKDVICGNMSAKQYIEKMIEIDFLEPLP